MKNSDARGPLHDPVMVDEILEQLKPGEAGEGIFLDGTTSTGGHALEIGRKLGPGDTLIGIDLDESALEVANERLEGLRPEVKLYRANFSDTDLVLKEADFTSVDGILLDLGFSSFQLENKDRGFSFQSDGPLDMRMDPEGETTAEDVVNNYSFEELKEIILRYGEEKWADGIAREIVENREESRVTTTGELVSVIKNALPESVKGRRRIHPATKTFQALRIEVNHEMKNLENGLETAFDCLKRGGVLAVISYHSLEDRRVKQFFRHKEKDCICPPDLPVCRCEKKKEVEITANGLTPTKKEVRENPRSRSGRLRAGRKLTTKS